MQENESFRHRQNHDTAATSAVQAVAWPPLATFDLTERWFRAPAVRKVPTRIGNSLEDPEWDGQRGMH